MLQVTDLDLFAIDSDLHLASSRTISEIKTGKGRAPTSPLDRILWKVGLRGLVNTDAAESAAALPAYGSAGTDYCEGDRHRVPSSARRNDRRVPSVPTKVE